MIDYLVYMRPSGPIRIGTVGLVMRLQCDRARRHPVGIRTGMVFGMSPPDWYTGYPTDRMGCPMEGPIQPGMVTQTGLQDQVT